MSHLAIFASTSKLGYHRHHQLLLINSVAGKQELDTFSWRAGERIYFKKSFYEFVVGDFDTG